MFEDFYEKQIEQHVYGPPNFENHYGTSRDYLMQVLNAMESGSRVLELGCYISKRLNWFAERNPKLSFVGVDLSPRTLKTGKDNCRLSSNLQLVAGDFQHLPFKSQEFDLIFSHLSLYHVSYANIRKVFKEIQRISKNDIVIIEPFHKVQSLKHKIYLLASPDKYAHDYRKFEKDNDYNLRDEVPVYDKSSNNHPITIFRFLRN